MCNNEQACAVATTNQPVSATRRVQLNLGRFRACSTFFDSKSNVIETAFSSDRDFRAGR